MTRDKNRAQDTSKHCRSRSFPGQHSPTKPAVPFLYANDGAGGTPVTLLWNSAVMAKVALGGGNDFVAP
jgi:hypothetical protein